MPDPAIPAAAGRGHPVVVGALGAAVLAGGAAVVVAEQGGLGALGGPGWGLAGGCGPSPAPANRPGVVL